MVVARYGHASQTCVRMKKCVQSNVNEILNVMRICHVDPDVRGATRESRGGVDLTQTRIHSGTTAFLFRCMISTDDASA